MHVAAFAPSWRPRPLAGGALLSVLVHALAIGAIAWAAAKPAAPAAQHGAERITTLWLLREPAAPAAPPVASPDVAAARSAAATHRETPPQRSAAMHATAARPHASHAAPPPPAPVKGIAFAVPALAINPTQALNGHAAPASIPVPHGPPPQWLMQPMQQAALAQIGYRLQQRLAAVVVPTGTDEGHCRLATDERAALVCDNPALQASVAADGPALASLLRAYRGLAPQLDHVALAYEQQRLRLDAR